MPKLHTTPTLLTEVMVFSVDAGGLGTKLPRLLANVVVIEPDVVGVQEVCHLYADLALFGLPCCLFTGVAVARGTVALLVHNRVWSHRNTRVEAPQHNLHAYLPVSEKVPLVMSAVHSRLACQS